MYIFISNSDYTLEKTSTDYNVPFLPIFALFMNIFLVSIDWFGIAAKLVPRLESFSKTRITGNKSSLLSDKTRVLDRETELKSLRREEVEEVMKRLGLFVETDDNQIIESERLNETSSFGCDELSTMFDKEEPSLGEIKEAFDVFDENRDGFVDAVELRRVLCLLGLRHVSDIERCKGMIANVDENGDGKIDFHEFVKFMETILC